jgi:hypothetical protein
MLCTGRWPLVVAALRRGSGMLLLSRIAQVPVCMLSSFRIIKFAWRVEHIEWSAVEHDKTSGALDKCERREGDDCRRLTPTDKAR